MAAGRAEGTLGTTFAASTESLAELEPLTQRKHGYLIPPAEWMDLGSRIIREASFFAEHKPIHTFKSPVKWENVTHVGAGKEKVSQG